MSNKSKSLVARDNKVSIESLLSNAVKSGVPVETMERLLVMRRELNAEQAQKEYDVAMAEFQMDCPVIQKTKEVRTRAGVVAYKYAPFEHIVATAKPFLQKHGFSYSIQTAKIDAGVKATCIAKHTGGHAEKYDMEVPLGNKTDIMSPTQVYAAAMTFAKRYAFCNAFGILVQDDDINATTGKEKIVDKKIVDIKDGEIKDAPNPADDIAKLRRALYAAGARNESQAVEVLKKKTGLVWKSVKEATPGQVKQALKLLK